MKLYLATTISLSSLLLFAGCSQNKTSVETRRDFAIQLNKNNLTSSKNVVRLKWSKDILSALASVNIETINSPKLASAVLAKGENKNYGLFVFWIQNHPTIDGLEFQFSKKTSSVYIPIPKLELQQNQSTGRDTIVFSSEIQWQNASDVWTNLEQLSNSRNLKIRLLIAEKPVTDWCPVSFYKVDHWISDN